MAQQFKANGLTLSPAMQSMMGQGQGLPRPPAEFTAQGFGPMAPMQPAPIDYPETGADLQPPPRRWQYMPGYNLPIGAPGSEGLKLVQFQVLRAYAEANSLVRACIETRKNEILGLDYDIVPTVDAEKRMRVDAGAHADFQERRKQALAFWARPDPDYDSFHSWFAAILESLLVDDAVALYLHPARVPGCGVFGTDVAALDWIDGSTIRPVIDVRGGRPRPPSVAFQQYIWGVPRVEMTDVLHDADLEFMGYDEIDADGAFRRDQLLYLRYVTRGWTPYGFPPTERCILPVITHLRRQEMGLEYFTEGTVPAAWVMIGGELNATPQQAKVWQDILNAVAGDTGYKQKIKVLPAGSTVQDAKPQPFDDKLLRAIQDDILMNFEIQPMEVGLAPGGHSSGMGGKGAGEASENVQARKGTKPLLAFLQRSIFNYLNQTVFGQYDMDWRFDGMDPAEDELKKAQVHKIYVSLGVETVDEVRQTELKLQPFGSTLTGAPFVLTATGPMPLGVLSPAAIAAEGDVGGGAFGEAAETPSTLDEQALLPPIPSPTTLSPAPAPPGPAVPVGPSGPKPGLPLPPVPAPKVATGSALVVVARPASWAVVEAELAKLRAYMRHGRDPVTFKSTILSEAALEAASHAFHGR